MVPLWANIVLHDVLDEWVELEVKPRIRGCCFLIRFADEFIIGCEREAAARRIMTALPTRCARFGPTIHPQKTRLVAFRNPGRKAEADNGNGPFEFPGFTHYWAQSRRGYWVLKRTTAKKRLRRAMRAVWQWCRHHRHDPLRVQYRQLSRKLQGHDQYYGIPGHYRKLEVLYQVVAKAWRYWLSRRGQQRAIHWEKFSQLQGRYPLPTPSIMHGI